VHHLVGVARVMLLFGHLVLGHHERQVGRCVHVIQMAFPGFVFFFLRHVGLLSALVLLD
jgi:hypothetical protein